MGRGRIQLKKIENVNNRLVTFSKRRNGLFKKAKELSVLCEAEVGIVVYSSNGKLYEFASHSMPQLLSKYKLYKGDIDESSVEPPPPTMTSKTRDYLLQGEINRLSNESAGLQKTVMMMLGKELDGLSYNDLQNLHRQVREGLLAIERTKEAIIMQELRKSSMQVQILHSKNEALRKQHGFLPAQNIEGPPMAKLEYRPLEPEANQSTTEIFPLQLI